MEGWRVRGCTSRAVTNLKIRVDEFIAVAMVLTREWSGESFMKYMSFPLHGNRNDKQYRREVRQTDSCSDDGNILHWSKVTVDCGCATACCHHVRGVKL